MKIKLVTVLLLSGWFLFQIFQNMHLSDLDVYHLNIRRSYYHASIAKFFQNKPFLILDHSQKAFFNSLPWL